MVVRRGGGHCYRGLIALTLAALVASAPAAGTRTAERGAGALAPRRTTELARAWRGRRQPCRRLFAPPVTADPREGGAARRDVALGRSTRRCRCGCGSGAKRSRRASSSPARGGSASTARSCASTDGGSRRRWRTGPRPSRRRRGSGARRARLVARDRDRPRAGRRDARDAVKGARPAALLGAPGAAAEPAAARRAHPQPAEAPLIATRRAASSLATASSPRASSASPATARPRSR